MEKVCAAAAALHRINCELKGRQEAVVTARMETGKLERIGCCFALRTHQSEVEMMDSRGMEEEEEEEED